MARRTKHAAVSVIMLGFGRSRLRIRRGRHFSTDRRHVEGVGGGGGDNAKCRDRRNQLHQYREQHDWNKYFQPPSHDFPRNASHVLPFASPVVEIACSVASMDGLLFGIFVRAREGIDCCCRSFCCGCRVQNAPGLRNCSPQAPPTPRHASVESRRVTALARTIGRLWPPALISRARRASMHGNRLAACINAGISATRPWQLAEAEGAFLTPINPLLPYPNAICAARCNLGEWRNPNRFAGCSNSEQSLLKMVTRRKRWSTSAGSGWPQG
jgi:hypothetical protein